MLGFLYLADEDLCKITWYYTLSELDNGISVVAFSSSEPDVVYAMGSGTTVNNSIMWVKDSRLF